MQANRKRRWPAERMPLQRTIMAVAIPTYPRWVTIPELSREIGSPAVLRRAALDLIQMGLLESHGSSVRPTKPIAHLELAGGLGVEPAALLAGIDWTPGQTTAGRFEFPDPAGSL